MKYAGEASAELRFLINSVTRGKGIWGNDGWFADVEIEDCLYGLSRMDGESHWYIDSKFGKNGFPYWCHGEGDRTTMKKYVNHSGIVAELDALAGLVPPVNGESQLKINW